MVYVSIINYTYQNLYGGMMRGKYYINITLPLFPLNHHNYVYTTLLCVNIIINNCIKPALCTTYYIMLLW